MYNICHKTVKYSDRLSTLAKEFIQVRYIGRDDSSSRYIGRDDSS